MQNKNQNKRSILYERIRNILSFIWNITSQIILFLLWLFIILGLLLSCLLRDD